jgi:hypothetical protein
MNRPLIAFDDEGRVQINYSGAMVGANPDYPLSSNAPKLSKRQVEALDKLNNAAKRVSFIIPHKPGDLLFINNYALLHARSSFEDSSRQRRHLLRSWFHDTEKGWTSAPALQRRNDIFELPSGNQMLYTAEEWDDIQGNPLMKLPGMLKFCHD